MEMPDDFEKHMAELRLDSADERAAGLDRSVRAFAAALKLEVAALILIDEKGVGHIFVDDSIDAKAMFQGLADDARRRDGESDGN